MAHLVSIVAVIVGCWIILALLMTLALGQWLQRAGNVPTGPATYRARVRSVARGARRLVVLPYVVESTAHAQARRRATRSRVSQRRAAAPISEGDAIADTECSTPPASGKEAG